MEFSSEALASIHAVLAAVVGHSQNAATPEGTQIKEGLSATFYRTCSVNDNVVTNIDHVGHIVVTHHYLLGRVDISAANPDLGVLIELHYGSSEWTVDSGAGYQDPAAISAVAEWLIGELRWALE